MRKLNPFFVIGTLGMLITSIFNILMAAIIPEIEAYNSASALYPVFLGFLLIGTAIMMKRKSQQEETED